MNANHNPCTVDLGSAHPGANSKFSLFRAWAVVFSTSLFFFFEFGLNNIFNVLEPYLSQDYQLGATAMGFISSLYFYANVIALIPAGILLDRFSPKKLILTATMVCVISLVGISFSHNLWWLCFARLVMGLAGGFCFIGVMRVVINWVPIEKMGLVSGFVVTMGMLGGFMVQTPMIAMIHAWTWRIALLGVALVGFLVFLVIFVVVKDHAPWQHEEYHGNRTTLRSMAIFKSLGLVFKNPQNWFAGLFTGLVNLPIFILGALWGVPYLINVHGLTDTQASAVAGMLFIGTMIGSPLMGTLADKLHSKKMLMAMGSLASLILASVIILGKINGFYPLLMLFCLLGMITSVQVLSYPLVAESNPKMLTSTAISVISMMCLLGGALSQPIFGKILSIGWSGLVINGAPVYAAIRYQYAAELLLFTFVIAFLLSLLIREKSSKKF
jgi:MFS family permease